jgi:predicted TIM-barrel fold metal-dependent hydrolase
VILHEVLHINTLIDNDVHNTFAAPKELLPYLPKVWHQQWLEEGPGSALKPWKSSSLYRLDATPEKGGPPASDPHFLLKDLVERYKMDYVILTGPTSLNGISNHFDPDYATAIASATNDWMVDKWLTVSPKFKGSILINNSDPQAAAKEIDRMGRHPDMVQVLMPHASRMLYGHRFYHPIYEAAERNRLVIAIHPGLDIQSLTPVGYPSRYVEHHTMYPLSFMANVNSMIFEGVFEKFPNLKVVCIEGGIAWLAHLMWRADKNYKALRDQVPWLKKLPSEYMREHIRLTTQPIEEPEKPGQLADLLLAIRAENMIMFATDYPHWDFDNPARVLLEFPKGFREKVSWQNASELYGL